MMTLPDSVDGQKDINSERERSRHTFIDDLTAFATEHHAQHWRGTFAEFLRDILPQIRPASRARRINTSMTCCCWYRDAQKDSSAAATAASSASADGPVTAPSAITEKALFAGELFGIDAALDRVVDYFKAAAAGSDVGRRLLLLLGPPSGGKSTLVILLKRGSRNTATRSKARCTRCKARRCTSRR